MSSKEKTKAKSSSSNVSDWIVKKSSKRQPGRYYYVNKKTGDCRWTPPRGCGDEDQNAPSEGDEYDEAEAGDHQISASLNRSNRATALKYDRSDRNATAFAPITPAKPLPSHPPKRKLPAPVKDLFNVGTNDAAYRPKKKRPRPSQDSPGRNVEDASSQNTSSPVNFSFKLPNEAKPGQLAVLEPAAFATPMDTSFSPIEDERMSPVPSAVDVNSSAQPDAVESMEVDEFVEEVNQLRKGAVSSIFDAASCATSESSGATWETVLAEVVMWNMVVIVDTNILLSDLPFLRDLDGYAQNGLTRIVVPYVVIRELDYLKVDRGSVLKKKQGSALAENARLAIAWISDQLNKGRRSNVIFQPDYADKYAVPGFEVTCNDDRVLKCAIEINSRRGANDAMTVLCTNDKNLLNKSKINGQRCVNKKELESYLQRVLEASAPSGVSETLSLSAEDALMAAMPSPHSGQSEPLITSGDNENAASASQNETKTEIDVVMDSCKNILVTVAENEMEEAFGDLWLEMVKVKRPWTTLADILNLFIQHWTAIFRFTCSGESKEELEKLYKDARHSLTFGFGQIGHSMLPRLTRLLKCISRNKSKYRSSTKSVCDQIQKLVSSSSGQ